MSSNISNVSMTGSLASSGAVTVCYKRTASQGGSPIGLILCARLLLYSRLLFFVEQLASYAFNLLEKTGTNVTLLNSLDLHIDLFPQNSVICQTS